MADKSWGQKRTCSCGKIRFYDLGKNKIECPECGEVIDISFLSNNKIEKNPIKRKGYYLGDRIGNYKIAQIEKRAVTLNTPSGQILTVKLIRRVPKMDKEPKKKQPKTISTRPNVKKRPQPSQRISGALTAPPPRHISGS